MQGFDDDDEEEGKPSELISIPRTLVVSLEKLGC